MRAWRVLFLAWCAAACTKTAVDKEITAIEIATTIDAADNITQLRLSGTIGNQEAFAPGLLPDVPRPLSGEQTAVVLLPDSLDGDDLLVRVDALSGDSLVHTGGDHVAVRAKEMRHIDITLGAPVICGDGVIAAPFENCDDSNPAAADGCSATCQVESGWNCIGMPSQCNPPSDHKEITSYAFLAIANPGLRQDVIAEINGTTISAIVPFGTNPSSLVATFAMTGVRAIVGGATQVSGATPNNFSSALSYTVLAEDTTVKTYSVSVMVANNTSKDITSFSFLAADNPGLGMDVTATINGNAIAATVPAGTNVTALVATFGTNGVGVRVGATPQVSGMTANNFTSPVAYTVTAGDSSTSTYTVTVTVAASSAKELTSFAFLSVDNPTLGMDITASISGTQIFATVPAGTDVTALVATFSTTGASVRIGATPQVSGATANDFTNPVTYTVVAGDSSTQTYSVMVMVAASSAKEITSFVFTSTDNPSLSSDVVATITGTTITATVPTGTNVSALVATFATSGATVAVGGVTQTSGVTPNNFTSPVVYTVTAADSSTKSYTVTVAVAAGSAKDITSFSFLTVNNPQLQQDIITTISGTSITATVPTGTNVNMLIATFVTTGAGVTVGGTVQNSGITPNNFTSPVVYTVTAADNSTKQYTVTITVAPSSAKDITAYSFLSVNNPSLPADVIGVITNTSIAVTVPQSTDVTALIATFSTTGRTVKVGVKIQSSGHTPNNFTSPVVYTVTAADMSTKQYTVTVTKL